MIKLMLAAALLHQASQAPAPPPPPVPVTGPARPDPARLEVARRVADAVWPAGTLARIYASGAGFEAADSLLPGLMGFAAQDSHFAERMRIMRGLMAAEYRPLAAAQEPFIRAALADAYARRFDTEQLTAAASFFATPAGRAIAAETQLMTLDPAIVRLMTPSFAESMRIMMIVQKKLEAATAHLPAPRPRERSRKAGERRR